MLADVTGAAACDRNSEAIRGIKVLHFLEELTDKSFRTTSQIVVPLCGVPTVVTEIAQSSLPGLPKYFGCLRSPQAMRLIKSRTVVPPWE